MGINNTLSSFAAKSTHSKRLLAINMPASTNRKVADILSGCEDLLNDFALPEEHDSAASAERRAKHRAAAATSTLDNTPGSGASTGRPSSVVVESELARSKKAWGRAIDRYVASVLDEHHGDDDGRSKKSSRPSKSKRSHPDNHLLAALQSDTASSVAYPTRRSTA